MQSGSLAGGPSIALEELHASQSTEGLVSKDEELVEVEAEDDDETDDYLPEVYAVLDAAVPRTDRPKLPALTFRVAFLGVAFGTLLCVGNTIFTFRSNAFTITPIVAAVLAYPCGQFMAAYLPKGWMNPGRFNHKEHGLIFICASAMASTPYALKNIIIQKYVFHQTDLSLLSCIVFAISTQCFGYSFAGLCRRYLVRPAVMLWPSNLATTAMLHSLHNNKEDSVSDQYPMSRYKFFWIATAAMACWEFLPSYLAPLLSAISVLCFFSDRSGKSSKPQVLQVLGSAQSGVGLLSFTLDWSLMTSFGPITTPFWAILNQFCGLWLCLWVVIPLLYFNSAFVSDQTLGTSYNQGPNGTNSSFPLGFALNSPDIFNSSGFKINVLEYYTWDRTTNVSMLLFNHTAYDAQGPFHITTYFAFEYMSAFLVFSASLVHIALWYGPELWFRFRAKLEDLDQEDIHNTLMDIYPVVPEAWYLSLLTWTGVWTIFVCQTEHSFNLPWFGVLLAIATALVSIVPFGIIQAISGQLIELKAVSELISGYIFQGDIMAVMTFKTLSSVAMSQGLVLVSDMKLGHYLKIPPRSLFITQFIGSVLGAVVSTLVSYLYAERMYKPSDPLSKNDALSTLVSPAMAESSWTGVQYRTFLSEGIIFGSIGPQKFFGPESDYSKILYGFAVGFCLPFIPWIMHKLRPVSAWHLVNVPLFFVFPAQVGGLRSDLITPFFAALGINYVIRSYRYIWWKKYAFVMSAAFDSGVAITLLLVFFLNSDLVNLPFPTYMLNRSDIEGCAPDYYLTCMAHKKMGNSLGKTYNVTEDSMCVGFQTGV